MSGDSFMTVPTDPSVVRRLRTASFAGSVACVIVGIVVLLGWLFDVPFLKSIHASFASMKPNTALGFVLIGSTLWLRRGEEGRTRASRLAHVLAAVVTLLGMLTFFEYASGWNLGIDELLFKEVLVASPAMPPGRMSPITAVMFTLMGSALLLLDVRLGESRRCPFQWLALLSALCALLSVLGYVYGVRGLYKIGPFTSIALHTAFAFLVGSGAVLLARPEDGLIRFVASDSPAGVMARRLLPAAILIPATLGWLRLKGQQAGYYDTEFGLALFAASNIVGFTALVWWNSGALSRADEERRRAEAAVRESEARKMAVMEAALDAIVLMDHEGKITDFNAAAERTFGYSHAEVVGKALAALLIPPALRDRHRAGLTRYLETGETHVLEEGSKCPLSGRTKLRFLPN